MATPRTRDQNSDDSSRKWWILFGIFFVLTVFFLVVNPTWFWVPLPFVLTFFVKAIGYM